MKTSAVGRELIERNEGLRLTAYQDTRGIWTIGYGDTGPGVVRGLTITKEDADRRFADRLADEFEPGVMAALGDAPTTQPQFDAMVSLAYNIGVGAFSKSSVRAMHVRGEYAKAADDFLMWNKSAGRVLAGLVRRRQEERALYLSDGKPASAKATPPAKPATPARSTARTKPRQDDDGEAERLNRQELERIKSQSV